MDGVHLTSASSRVASMFLQNTAVGHHGFDLARELDLGQSNVYAILRLWSAAGIVTSTYQSGGAAPRRVYKLTPAGAERLREIIFGEAES